jgi:thioredoxin 1
MKTILYFTADWCHPCKKVRPIVDELNREQTQVKFQIIDVDDEMEMARMWNVSSIPTFVVITYGTEKHRVTGAQTREQLEELIKYEYTKNNN